MATTNTVIPTELPSLTLEQVRQKLVALLSDAANLGVYIERVNDGTIFVKDFTMIHPTGCSTKPRQTLVGEPVPPDWLQLVADAILSVNEDFRSGEQLHLVLSKIQPGCLTGP